MAVKEKAKESLIAEDKTKESSSFKKWKELAATGLLSASLLLSPINVKAIMLKDTVELPIEYSEVYKKDYNPGWNLLLDADKLVRSQKTGGKPYYNKAISYFEKKFKEDQRPESLYALAYCYYSRPLSQKDYESAEKDFRKAIELLDEGTKRFNLPIFISLKAAALQNAGQMYFDSYKESGTEVDRKKAIQYLNSFLDVSKLNKESMTDEERKFTEGIEEKSRKMLSTLQN